MDPTQDAPPPGEVGAQVAPEDAGLAAEAARAERLLAAGAVGGAMHRGLLRWTLLVAAGSVAALVLDRPDAALFLAAAALFALAQSWDVRDRARTGDHETDVALAPGGVGSLLRAFVPLLVPFAGALVFCGLAMFARGLSASAAQLAALRWCIAATAACVLGAFPPVARLVARVFVRGANPGHTDRLTASVALTLLLVPVPFQLLSEE